MTNFFELAQKRQSCRKYDPARIPEKEMLLKCVEAGLLAPSACNSQPWHFTVVNDPEMSPKVAKCAQSMGINKYTDDCPAFIVVTEKKARLMRRIADVMPSQHFAQIDVGLAVAHICLQAEELGLSTSILGAFDEPAVAELLGIEERECVRLIIAIGYGLDEYRSKVRKPEEDVVRYIG